MTETIAELMILASVIPATFGPILFATGGPWWKHNIGRALLIAWISIGLLINWAAVFVVFGADFPGRELARISVFATISIGLWYLFFTMLGIRRKARRELKSQAP